MTLVALWCGLAPRDWIPRREGAFLEGIAAWAALLLLVGTVATAVLRLGRIGRALRR